eukprot:gnl/TRDRNA2_/TRDRNA2_125262_c0_seq1.p1 gnl/TRDRNA2_/TRDRNA2_125262_c0~~gnl/TRDRNA2_/TRDRNA2_125262_c0_seq1.p1  ORF type:complete len:358 (+),score=42.32 gnl/TRDRNA2_/TRDRNA2_125262_c0_seq1:70-1143(+)
MFHATIVVLLMAHTSVVRLSASRCRDELANDSFKLQTRMHMWTIETECILLGDLDTTMLGKISVTPNSMSTCCSCATCNKCSLQLCNILQAFLPPQRRLSTAGKPFPFEGRKRQIPFSGGTTMKTVTSTTSKKRCAFSDNDADGDSDFSPGHASDNDSAAPPRKVRGGGLKNSHISSKGTGKPPRKALGRDGGLSRSPPGHAKLKRQGTCPEPVIALGRRQRKAPSRYQDGYEDEDERASDREHERDKADSEWKGTKRRHDADDPDFADHYISDDGSLELEKRGRPPKKGRPTRAKLRRHSPGPESVVELPKRQRKAPARYQDAYEDKDEHDSANDGADDEADSDDDYKIASDTGED